MYVRSCRADGVFVHDAGLDRHAMLLHPLSALFVCRVCVRARLNPCAEHLVVHVCEPE